MIDYLLVVLTHGRHGPTDTLEWTLASFLERVTPSPVAVYLHQDGSEVPSIAGGTLRFDGDDPSVFIDFHQSSVPIGFCAATAKAWAYASMQSMRYVFWLEHDFLLLRELDLDPLEYVLFRDRTLAQMALMRNAVNPEEKVAGGLFELRRDDYQPEPEGWLSHRSYFTTNPSLMRTDWMRSAPFLDDGQPQCEGRYGIDLVRRGYRFGVWGDGSPWVKHFGIRTGKGY